MYFENYVLRKTYLKKSLKNPIPADTLVGGMVKGKKHC